MKLNTTTSTLFTLLFLACGQLVVAGTSGKISGRTTGKEFGDPLLGVNIIIEGFSIGGVSDLEGNYVILNVPPGTYRVKASMVGYAPVVFSDVRVFIDQTTTINFELPETSVQVSEVVVVAPREVVKRDVSTSVASFAAEELKALPITAVTNITALQAGVEGGGLVIRGGGADQSLFLLDGATMRDPRNNQPITAVPMSAVSEVSVERGSFNAEYGQVRSGIINVVTKEGSRNAYTLSLTARAMPPARKYFGESPFNANSFWLRPYLDPSVAWTGTKNGAWDFYTYKQYPEHEGWNTVSQRLLTDPDSTNDLSPAALQRLFMWEHRRTEPNDKFDYNFDGGIGGPFPFISELAGDLRFFLAFRNQRDMLLVPLSVEDYYEETWSLRLTSDVGKAMKLDLTGTMGSSTNVAVNGTEQASSTDYIRSAGQVASEFSLRPFSNSSRLFVDSYYGVAEVENFSMNALFTHIVSPTTVYEMRAEYLQRDYLTGPIRNRNTAKSFQLFPGYYVDESPFGWSTDVGGTYDGMFTGGHTATARDSTSISALTLKGDITSQVNANNQFRGGFEFVYNDLDLNYGVVNIPFPESNNYVRQRYFPVRGAVFLQDKIEYEGFIANVGLRLDYSDANVEWYDVADYDKTFVENADAAAAYPRSAVSAKWMFSPRFGISHPITEESKLFFNYGHFKQMPTYEQMLRYSRNVTGSLRNFGDPELEAANTVAYELGYDQQLFEEYLLQIAGFYRDIQSQLAFSTYTANKRKGNFRYISPNNNSYQDVRGFEITLRKQAGSWVNGFANYTYQSTKSGVFGNANVLEDPSAQKIDDLNTRLLYQSKPIPTPFARFNVSFFTPEDFGPSIGSTSIFGDWTLALFGEWRSGGYTSVSNFIATGATSEQFTVPVVDFYNMNLRFSKNISMGPLKFFLFADVSNLLNTKRLNLNSFYNSEDMERYFNSLHLDPSAHGTTIPGSDKVGDFRTEDVSYQPIVRVANLASIGTPSADPLKEYNDRVIYYDASSGQYMQYTAGAWREVDRQRLDRIIEDKAYIDMPNLKSFWFLLPRQIFFGITTTIEF